MTDKDEIIADFLIFTTHRFLLDESNKLIQTEEGYRDYMLNALKVILSNNDGISIYSDSDSIHVVAHLDDKDELDLKKAEIEKLKDVVRVHYEFHRHISRELRETIAIYDKVKAIKKEFESSSQFTAEKLAENEYKVTSSKGTPVTINGNNNNVIINQNDINVQTLDLNDINKKELEEMIKNTVKELSQEQSKQKSNIWNILSNSALFMLLIKVIDLVASKLPH